MSYAVKKVFLSLQGEGANIGRPTVFLRFSGCNLWSGLERDRVSADCNFCDTSFRGGENFKNAAILANRVAETWGSQPDSRMVVVTGGEPMLQYDEPLRVALKALGFFVAAESNGTVAPAADVDWLCVSPKTRSLSVNCADELKFVYPQVNLKPEDFDAFEASVRWLSPMDGPRLIQNTKDALAYCLANPGWRMAIQAHKIWGVD